MNTFGKSGTPRRRAVALIITLGFLVLIAATIVGFFASATSARRESAGYESGIAAKQLADVVTNIVIGQISDGTRSWEIPPSLPSEKGGGARLSYSTQPGLIRSYTDTGGRGRIFKLYSSDTMVTSPGTAWSVSAQLANEVPANWPGQPAHFVDVNQPVLVEDTAGLITRSGSSRKFSAVYPVLNPLALLPVSSPGTGVEGFDLRGIPGYKGGSGQPAISTSYDPTAPADSGLTSNPAPMPVRWIYVLQDGTLTVPNAVTGSTLAADWSGLPDGSPLKPSKANPIVGRIAFWTDDETCKLNINTASEPTPWDTPRAVTAQDMLYGRFQPAQREFQRFPGHPFTTALSPVLFPGVKLSPQQKEDIYSIIPRVNIGGSKAATVPVIINAGPTSIVPDSDRLFASGDELLFAATNTSGVRQENPSNSSTLPKFREQLKRARFFLTASSRAPEVNLLGQPRISLWPVSSTAASRTPYDKLAAFCSTVGDGTAKPTTPFYFQRSNSTSPSADYDGIPRNMELYKWLQDTTAKAIPGYGGNFLKKWGADRDQILTEIFDYIRCVNLHDSQKNATFYASNGQVTPIQIGDTRGFGRFYTLSQFGFHFICAQDGTEGAVTEQNPKLEAGQRAIEAAFIMEPFTPSFGYYQINENFTVKVQFTTPFTINGQDLKMQSDSGTLNNSIPGGWHGMPFGGAAGIRAAIASLGGGSYKLASKASPRVKVPAASGTMDFSGGTITVDIYSGPSATGNPVQTFTLNFPGGQIPIPKLVSTGTTVFRGAQKTDKEQWWTFNGYTEWLEANPTSPIPAERVPHAGKTFAGRYSGVRSCPHQAGDEYYNLERRHHPTSGTPGFKNGGVFRQEDVVRTIVPDHGDIRLIAAQKNVTADQFVKVRSDLWSDSKTRFLHIFTTSFETKVHFGFANEPGPSPAEGVPSAASDDQLHGSDQVPLHHSHLPEIRPGAGKLYNRWGDFDNGISRWQDGAFINKPDEGNINYDSRAQTNGIDYAYFSWNYSAANENYFSPSRMIPSAGMLGSLPTGLKRHTVSEPHAWETLLFRPELRKAGGQPHPGTVTPKDHLIMDLFWMPVNEPYAISEPFSTAGKINLNYEIAPFSYIRRATALHGAMKAEEPLAIINAASRVYKLWDHETNDWPLFPNDSRNKDPITRTQWDALAKGQTPYNRMRRPIDVTETLKQAEDRFAKGDAFRSATEICELHLVREGETLDDYKNDKIWPGALVTGENTRERPYTNLYGKLTTRSNTFNVHMRVQVLRKRPGGNTDYAVWNEDTDSVLAEHRGSALIERYVDASDPNLPDFAIKTDATLDNYARFRILSTNKFTP